VTVMYLSLHSREHIDSGSFCFIMTEYSDIQFIQLVRVLEELKDEQAALHSHRMGKTLAWNHETGTVMLTVRKSLSVAVNVKVETTLLWKKYMDGRKLIHNRFYFEEGKQTDEVHVRNETDVSCMSREMRYLNWLRLNLFKEPRRMALAMGAHSRLGADSQLLTLDGNVLTLIGMLL
jgi:hypothetical protein